MKSVEIGAEFMTAIKITQNLLLAVVCCFALILAPLPAGAQGGIIKKGVEGVQKGVDYGVDKTKEGVHATKEGAEKAGRGVKKAVTGEETTTREKTVGPYTTEPTQTTPSQARSERRTGRTTTATTRTERGETGRRRLPKTAGELPLIALLGGLALGASGILRLSRRGN